MVDLRVGDASTAPTDRAKTIQLAIGDRPEPTMPLGSGDPFPITRARVLTDDEGVTGQSPVVPAEQSTIPVGKAGCFNCRLAVSEAQFVDRYRTVAAASTHDDVSAVADRQCIESVVKASERGFGFGHEWSGSVPIGAGERFGRL